jgi:hypothetical protein
LSPGQQFPVQTFLPVPDFHESARLLDRRRLGKQRVEAWMIHDILTNPDSRWKSWLRHPVVPMWRGYEDALSLYFWAMVEEWKRRGYRSTIELPVPPGEVELPPWLGDERLHGSHRSRLLQKEPEWYGRFGWREESGRPYWWPSREIPREAP